MFYPDNLPSEDAIRDRLLVLPPAAAAAAAIGR